MPTRQDFFSIGTTPAKVLLENSRRVGWRITMYASGIETGNTGRIHMGRGYVPGNVLGQPNVGDILVQGSEMSEEKSYPEEVIFTGEIWLIGSIADQRISVEETVPPG